MEFIDACITPKIRRLICRHKKNTLSFRFDHTFHRVEARRLKARKKTNRFRFENLRTISVGIMGLANRITRLGSVLRRYQLIGLRHAYWITRGVSDTGGKLLVEWLKERH